MRQYLPNEMPTFTDDVKIRREKLQELAAIELSIREVEAMRSKGKSRPSGHSYSDESS